MPDALPPCAPCHVPVLVVLPIEIGPRPLDAYVRAGIIRCAAMPTYWSVRLYRPDGQYHDLPDILTRDTALAVSARITTLVRGMPANQAEIDDDLARRLVEATIGGGGA